MSRIPPNWMGKRSPRYDGCRKSLFHRTLNGFVATLKYRKMGRPTMWALGKKPQYRLSYDAFRLSPIMK